MSARAGGRRDREARATDTRCVTRARPRAAHLLARRLAAGGLARGLLGAGHSLGAFECFPASKNPTDSSPNFHKINSGKS